MSRPSRNDAGRPRRQSGEERLAAGDRVKPTDQRLALDALSRYQREQYLPDISDAAVTALWRRFVAARHGELMKGWEAAWQNAFDDERRAIQQFKRRRQETLAAWEKAARTREAMFERLGLLTPAERRAEHASRMAITEAEYDTRKRLGDLAAFVRKSLAEHRQLRQQQATPEELHAHDVVTLIARLRRGLGLPDRTVAGIVEEAKQQALLEAAEGPFPEAATCHVHKMFAAAAKGTGDAEAEATAEVARLKDEHRRLVESNRRAANNRLIERDRAEMRAQRQRDLMAAEHEARNTRYEMPRGARSRLRRRPPTDAEREAVCPSSVRS
jgi:hypothetical protein